MDRFRRADEPPPSGGTEADPLTMATMVTLRFTLIVYCTALAKMPRRIITNRVGMRGKQEEEEECFEDLVCFSESIFRELIVLIRVKSLLI